MHIFFYFSMGQEGCKIIMWISKIFKSHESKKVDSTENLFIVKLIFSTLTSLYFVFSSKKRNTFVAFWKNSHFSCLSRKKKLTLPFKLQPTHRWNSTLISFFITSKSLAIKLLSNSSASKGISKSILQKTLVKNNKWNL